LFWRINPLSKYDISVCHARFACDERKVAGKVNFEKCLIMKFYQKKKFSKNLATKTDYILIPILLLQCMFMIHITSKWIYVSNKLMYELVRFSGLYNKNSK